MTSEWIHRLDNWLQHNRPEYYQSLRPGLTEAEFAELECELGVTLPDDFRALYCWRNGSNLDEPVGLDYLSWMSADAVVYQWKSLRNVAFSSWQDLQPPEYLKSIEEWWNDKWIPFQFSWRGDVLCLDLEGSFGGGPGQLLKYVHDDEPREIYYPSIEAWLKTLVTNVETSGLTWEEWDDYDLTTIIAASNPGYPKIVPEQRRTSTL